MKKEFGIISYYTNGEFRRLQSRELKRIYY